MRYCREVIPWLTPRVSRAMFHDTVSQRSSFHGGGDGPRICSDDGLRRAVTVVPSDVS